MKPNKNPFESEQWFATLMEINPDIQKNARNTYRSFLASQNKKRNWIQTILYYSNHPVLFVVRHAVLAGFLVILGGSIMAAATSEFISPTNAKPSTIMRNIFAGGEQDNDNSIIESQIMQSTDDTYITAIDECGLAFRYNKHMSINKYALSHSSLFRIEDNIASNQSSSALLQNEAISTTPAQTQEVLSIMCGSSAQELYNQNSNLWRATDPTMMNYVKDWYLFADKTVQLGEVFLYQSSESIVLYFEHNGTPTILQTHNQANPRINIHSLSKSNQSNRSYSHVALIPQSNVVPDNRIISICGVSFIHKEYVEAIAELNVPSVSFGSVSSSNGYSWKFLCNEKNSLDNSAFDNQLFAKEIKELILTKGITNPAGVYEIQSDAISSNIHYSISNLKLTITIPHTLSPLDQVIEHEFLINGLFISPDNNSVLNTANTQTEPIAPLDPSLIDYQIHNCTPKNQTFVIQEKDSQRFQIRISQKTTSDQITKILNDARTQDTWNNTSQTIQELLTASCIYVEDIQYLKIPSIAGNSQPIHYILLETSKIENTEKENTDTVFVLATLSLTPSGILDMTISSPISQLLQEYLTQKDTATITLSNDSSSEYREIELLLKTLNQIQLQPIS